MSAKKILIGYDGSPCADAALLDLKKAGLPKGTSALIVTVAEVFLPPSRGTENPLGEPILTEVQKGWKHAQLAVKDAQKMAEYGAHKIKKAFPDWKIQSAGFADSATWGMIGKAKSWKADLIVVGAHGLSITGRILLGSISQIVATQASCSVRIVHGKPEEVNSPSRIIVGVDGSSGSYKAIDEVTSRNWKKGSSIHFVTIMDSRLKTTGLSQLKTLHRRIEQAKSKLAKKGCAAASINKEGDPKKVLLAEAKRWGADCIFVGSRGLSGIKDILLGSVSAALAARAECPVEIVR